MTSKGDDKEAASAPAATTTTSAPSVTADLIATTKQALSSLHAQRQALETEAAAIVSELNAPTGNEGDGPPMGIDTPLVDGDGYPRNDIDIVRARTLRGRLAVLRTDHRRLSEDLERQLQMLAMLQNPNRQAVVQAEQTARQQPKPKPKFDPESGKWVVKNWDGTLAGAPAAAAGGGNNAPRSFDTLEEVASTRTATDTTAQTPQSQQPQRPFAKVDAVAAHSPAEAAGLLPDDLILRFGDITLAEQFGELANIVPQAAGQGESVEIVVQRKVDDISNHDTIVSVQLVPRPWAGRGLIGCHIVPYHGS